MDPDVPEVLATFLASLKGAEAEVVYKFAVSAAPSNYVSLALQDATQARGNDNYGEGA